MDEVSSKVDQATAAMTALQQQLDMLERSIHDLQAQVDGDSAALQQGMAGFDQSIDGCIEQIRQTQADLHGQVEGVEEELGRMEGRMEEGRRQATALLEKLQEGLSGLERSLEEDISDIEQQSQESQVAFGAVREVGDEAILWLKADLPVMQEHLQELRHSTEESHDSLLNAQQAMAAQAQEARTQLTSRLHALGERFERMATSVSGQAEEMLEAVDRQTDEVLAAQEEAFLRTALEAIREAASTLEEAGTQLTDDGDSQKEGMLGKAGDLLDDMEGVLNVIEKIKPILDMIDKIL